MPVKRAISLEDMSSGTAGPAPWHCRTRRLISTLVAVPALLAMTACGGTAPSQPTVQAVATQAVGTAGAGVGTAVAGASPAAATAVAAASPAAATAQAAASPVAATSASIIGTAVGSIPALASPSPSPSPAAQVPLRIADASLSDATPWLSIQNDGNAPVDVGGWRLDVGTATAEIPESAVVEPGGTLTLHAGAGMSSEDEVYLGDAGELLASAAQPGAPVRLSDGSGRTVAEATVPRF
jgi:hypothetical protein